MPTNLKYKMLVSFCLTSVLPILAGAYAVSLFVKFPFEADPATLATVSLVCLFSLFLSFLGYQITRQTMTPIADATLAAKNIAQGRLDEEEPEVSPDAADEIQDLTRSLKMISHNAKELLEKVEKLSMKDKLTGLYNSTYIRERLDEEIQRSIHYQRPCSFAYVLLQNYDTYEAAEGDGAAAEALKQVADVLNVHIREFDRAARISRGEFVVIFPDRNKKSAIEIVEKIGRKVETLPAFAKEKGGRLAFCAGISENPIDGVHADGLYLKAQNRMKMASQAGKLMEAFA